MHRFKNASTNQIRKTPKRGKSSRGQRLPQTLYRARREHPDGFHNLHLENRNQEQHSVLALRFRARLARQRRGYRGTSLIRNSPPPGPYIRNMPRVLGGS